MRTTRIVLSLCLGICTALALIASPARSAIDWGKPTRVIPLGYDLRVAVDGQGAVTTTAVQSGRQYRLHIRRRTARGHWLPTQTIPLQFGFLTGSYNLAVSRAGRGLIVYTENVPFPDGTVQTTLLTRGTTGRFHSPFFIESLIAPTVEFDDSERAVIAGISSDAAIVARRRSPDGTLSAPQVVAQFERDPHTFPRGANAPVPTLAMGAGGRAVLVWVQRLGDRETALQAAFAAPGEPFGPPQEVARFTAAPPGENFMLGEGIRQPAVSVNRRGQTVLTWMAGGRSNEDVFDPQGSNLMSAFAPADGGFGAPRVVVTDVSAYNPQVAVDPLGGGALTWRTSGRTAALYASTALADGRFGAPRKLGNGDSNALAADSRGDLLQVARPFNSLHQRRCPSAVGFLRQLEGRFGRAARLPFHDCIMSAVVAAGGGRRTFAVATNLELPRAKRPVVVTVGRAG
jgi:hypothetical protein